MDIQCNVPCDYTYHRSLIATVCTRCTSATSRANYTSAHISQVYYGAIPIWFRGRFAKSYESPELRSSSYDFNSIMHYGPMVGHSCISFVFEKLDSVYRKDVLY